MRGVVRELDSAERAADAVGECGCEDGLAHAWHIFEEHVPTGEQTANDSVDGSLIADEDLTD